MSTSSYSFQTIAAKDRTLRPLLNEMGVRLCGLSEFPFRTGRVLVINEAESSEGILMLNSMRLFPAFSAISAWLR